MSLLRTVLKKNSSSSPGSPAPFNPGGPTKRPFFSAQSSAASFKSVASTIQSISSFYSTLTKGGAQVPKRRKPDVSRLGAPRFYENTPSDPERLDGVEVLSREELDSIPLTAGHAESLNDSKTGEPWLSVILYSHAKPSNRYPRYHNEGACSLCILNGATHL